MDARRFPVCHTALLDEVLGCVLTEHSDEMKAENVEEFMDTCLDEVAPAWYFDA
jgi:hypothetical protein